MAENEQEIEEREIGSEELETVSGGGSTDHRLEKEGPVSSGS